MNTWGSELPPFVVATENDALNGVAMLFGHRADSIKRNEIALDRLKE
ncbi:MAG TPA: hypothetical protein DIC34_13680 [Treponema sp.]|nr:hypothetical protein [Treponema sp.]